MTTSLDYIKAVTCRMAMTYRNVRAIYRVLYKRMKILGNRGR